MESSEKPRISPRVLADRERPMSVRNAAWTKSDFGGGNGARAAAAFGYSVGRGGCIDGDTHTRAAATAVAAASRRHSVAPCGQCFNVTSYSLTLHP